MGDHVHAALRDFLSRVPLSQRTVESMEGLLREKWRRFRHGFRDAEDEKRWAQKALAQVREFALSQDVSACPYMVEASIEAEITPGLVLRGRVDRVDREADGGLHIIDYKTGRVPEVSDWSQLYLYALILTRRVRLPVSRVSFLYLGSGAVDSAEPTQAELDHTTWELLVTADRIKKARSYPAQKGKWCSGCDFSPICKGSSLGGGGGKGRVCGCHQREKRSRFEALLSRASATLSYPVLRFSPGRHGQPRGC
jgi:putative RecB family exonuclease